DIVGKRAAGRIIVRPAAIVAVEMVVAEIVGTGFRGKGEMPFCDEGGAITGLFEQGGHGGMAGRQGEQVRRDRDRLLEADGQALLVAAGGERGPRGTASPSRGGRSN